MAMRKGKCSHERRTIHVPPFSVVRLHYGDWTTETFTPGGGTWDIIRHGSTRWLMGHRSGEKWLVARGFEAATDSLTAPKMRTLNIIWEQDSESKWSACHPLYDGERMLVERVDHKIDGKVHRSWQGKARGVHPLDGGDSAEAVAWAIAADILRMAMQMLHWGRPNSPLISERAQDLLTLSSSAPFAKTGT